MENQLNKKEGISGPVFYTCADAAMQFYNKMSTRRSIRDFSDQPVDIDLVKAAIAAAGTSPSGANKQPWFFSIITDQTIKDCIRKAAENVENAFYATSNLKKWIYPVESTCIATGILLTSLHLSGLNTLTHTPRPIGFLNSILNLDKTFKPLMLVVVGHAAENAWLPPIQKKHSTEIMKIY
tara:strand:- start:4101 stop:4643 length:543 start_codon:yes stop_codon:yes gene_type:complete